MKKRFTRSMLWGGILCGIFTLSLVLYIFTGSSYVNRVLFFPVEGSLHLAGELRRLPKEDRNEDNIELLVDELILGPVDLSFKKLLPKDTTVRTCMLRDRTVYLDLSPELIVNQEGTELSVDESLLGIERSIRYNFPGVEDVIFFIDGEMYDPGPPDMDFWSK